MDASVKKRFLAFVRVEANGCWFWTGWKNKARVFKGHKILPYGRFKMAGVSMPAHRASWIIFKGPIPNGKKACHNCDNPECVNPEHLYIGTTKKNNQDCRRRDRHSHGKRSPNAKLSDEIVRQIRAEYRPYNRKSSAEVFARQYGVNCTVILEVAKGIRWAHVK